MLRHTTSSYNYETIFAIGKCAVANLIFDISLYSASKMISTDDLQYLPIVIAIGITSGKKVMEHVAPMLVEKIISAALQVNRKINVRNGPNVIVFK
jgi:hypothetical protein